MSSLDVRPVGTRREARAFLELPYALNRTDPNWVAPLRMAERRRWEANGNASLRRLDAARFVAWRGRRAVGRIAAMADPLFQRWLPGSGFFGFFESEDDPDVGLALLETAEEVLRRRGLSFVLGPVNHTTHEEVGFLVEGFHRPPTVLAPYNPPRYPALIVRAGYQGIRDYRAFEWTPASLLHPSVQRLARSLVPSRGLFRSVTIRPLDPQRWDQDLHRVHELYNACFHDVWGFVEISWEEFKERADPFRAFYRPELAILAEEGGEAVGFALVLPDVNSVLARLGGRLLPFGWLRARRAVPAIRTGRFILMGVRPDREGRGLAPAMSLFLRSSAMTAGFKSIEISLVQAANLKMLRVVEALGCRPIKAFRVFGKSLDGSVSLPCPPNPPPDPISTPP